MVEVLDAVMTLMDHIVICDLFALMPTADTKSTTAAKLTITPAMALRNIV